MSKKIEYKEVDKETYDLIHSQYKEGKEKQDFFAVERYYVNKELLQNE